MDCFGIAVKHKVLNHESFPYILSFSDKPQKFSPSNINDLTYTVIHVARTILAATYIEKPPIFQANTKVYIYIY